jgi:uncharacterized protein (TIGR02145 family)
MKETIEAIKLDGKFWMSKNLNINVFRNGDTIPYFQSENYNASVGKEPACCYYNYDPNKWKEYGMLYNWAAVNDRRGLAPDGWHIPSYNDWYSLICYLRAGRMYGNKCIMGIENAGGLLKEKGTKNWLLRPKNHWLKPNIGANNLTGFTALPGGQFDSRFLFYGLGESSHWWTSTTKDTYDIIYACCVSLYNNSASIQEGQSDISNFYSVRCIRY